MDYPKYRPRRVRRNERLRELVRETRLTPKNLIYPLFVAPGRDRLVFRRSGRSWRFEREGSEPTEGMAP